MKSYLFTMILGLFSLLSFGQKTIEKNIAYSGQYIDMDVQFARHIEVKTWDKSEIYFKANLEAEKKYLDLYDLTIDEGSERIKIKSDPDKMFKQMWEDKKAEMKGKDHENYINTGDEYEFNYVLYVPKNSKFKVSSINGDLTSSIIEGEFEADLINGNINIAQYSGDLTLSTINGVIDLKIKDASLNADTLHGNIYGDEALNFEVKDNLIGREVSGEFDTAKNTLKLHSINGDMYLRKG